MKYDFDPSNPPPELRDLLQRGYGNNLEVVSLLADLGRLTLEDNIVNPGKVSNTDDKPKSIKEHLYGDAKAS